MSRGHRSSDYQTNVDGAEFLITSSSLFVSILQLLDIRYFFSIIIPLYYLMFPSKRRYSLEHGRNERAALRTDKNGTTKYILVVV